MLSLEISIPHGKYVPVVTEGPSGTKRAVTSASGDQGVGKSVVEPSGDCFCATSILPKLYIPVITFLRAGGQSYQ